MNFILSCVVGSFIQTEKPAVFADSRLSLFGFDVFFYGVATAEDDFDSAVMVYLDALNHLTNDGIIVFVGVSLSFVYHRSKPCYSRLIVFVNADAFLDSFDSAFELLDFFGDALEFILVAFDVRARFNALGYHVQHFGIESVDSALQEVYLVRATVDSDCFSDGCFHH